MMKVFKCVLMVFGVAVGCLSLATETRQPITGVAEYSFNDKYKILRAPGRLYQLKSEALSFEEKAKLEQIGWEVTVSLTSRDIENSWQVDQAKATPNLGATKERRTYSFVEYGNTVIIVGEILPTTAETEAMVQVGERIYRINKAGLEKSERIKLSGGARGVTLTLPSSAILSFWDTGFGLVVNRLPAAKVFDRKIERVGDRIYVNGTVGFSYDERDLLVQSGQQCILLKRANFSALESDFQTGSQVSFLIPKSEAVFTCAKND